MLPPRDFDTNPYTADEQRVVEYIKLVTKDQMGGGDDPIGFLLASHVHVIRQKTKLQEVQETFNYLCKWVERGLFDNMVSAQEALSVIAHHPGLPWTEGRWDVDHKPYAKTFYKMFPKAAGSA